jgi:hypothetical protein
LSPQPRRGSSLSSWRPPVVADRDSNMETGL